VSLWIRAGAIEALVPGRVFDTIREVVSVLGHDPAGTGRTGDDTMPFLVGHEGDASL